MSTSCILQVEEEKDEQLASLSAQLLKLHASLLSEKKRILGIIQVILQRLNQEKNCYYIRTKLFFFQDKDRIISYQGKELDCLRQQNRAEPVLASTVITREHLSKPNVGPTRPENSYQTVEQDSPKPPLPSRHFRPQPPPLPRSIVNCQDIDEEKSFAERLAVDETENPWNRLAVDESRSFLNRLSAGEFTGITAVLQLREHTHSLFQNGGQGSADQSADVQHVTPLIVTSTSCSGEPIKSCDEWTDKDDSGRESDDTLDGSENSKDGDLLPAVATTLSLLVTAEAPGGTQKTTVKFWTDSYL
jgi:hypothetical protein